MQATTSAVQIHVVGVTKQPSILVNRASNGFARGLQMSSLLNTLLAHKAICDM